MRQSALAAIGYAACDEGDYFVVEALDKEGEGSGSLASQLALNLDGIDCLAARFYFDQACIVIAEPLLDTRCAPRHLFDQFKSREPGAFDKFIAGQQA